MIWNRARTPRWKRVAFAILCIGIAIGIRIVFMQILGKDLAYVTFSPAVALAALYGGFFSGLIATIGSALFTSYFFIEPLGGPLVINSTKDLFGMFLFIVSSLIVSGICEVMHQAREKLREQTADLAVIDGQRNEILESISDGFFALDNDLIFIYLNKEAEKIFSIPSEQLLGKNILEFYAMRDMDEQQLAYFQAIQEKHSFHGEIRGVLHNECWYDVHVYPGKNGLSVYLHDITQQRNAQRRIQEQAELLDLAYDYIMVRDLDSRIIYWNHGAEIGYGWTVAEALGKVTHDLLQTIFVDSLEQIMDELMNKGNWEGELTHTLKNGQQIVVKSYQTLRRNAEGQPISILEINHNITVQKQAEEKLLAWSVSLENKVMERTLELQDINSILEEEIMERQAAQDSLQDLNDSLEAMIAERTINLQDMNAKMEEEIVERQATQESLSLLTNELENKVIDRTKKLQDMNQKLEEEIMERQAIQEALEEEKERYEALLQQSSEAVVIVEFDSKKIVETNESFDRMFGYPAEQLANHSIIEIGLLDSSELEALNSSEMDSGILESSIRRYQSIAQETIHAERTGSFIRYRGKNLLMLSYHDVTAERKLQATIQEQLVLAADVQKSMLPEDYQDEKIIVRGIFNPLMMVSGDFYGYHWSADGNRLNGYLIDVTGHGIATALYSTAVNSLLNEAISDGKVWTQDKVAKINQRLIEYLNDTTFVAIMAFTFDFKEKQLTCITGGINYMLTSSEKHSGLVAIPGIYFGVTPHPNFGMVTIPIQNGDTFYFMTDGIYERLSEEVVDYSHDFESISHALTRIAENKSDDDCSALCVQITGLKSFPIFLNFSSKNDTRQIRSRINYLLNEITGQKRPKVEVALGEAIANALRVSAEVRVKINKIGRILVMRVKDSGSGFDGNGAVKKNIAIGLEQVFLNLIDQDRGRGIPIMIVGTDQVIYNQQGNEVMLMKYLDVAE
ncbi:PAS domain S-box protein [Pelosinus sp. sgz500959]|uniref:PAS domain S-box protein n=1 Tax=Pelosinus sp. sgz500959 TaxID=3242472 RepID=UPI00366C0CF0